MRRRPSGSAITIAVGVALVVGVIVTNAVHRIIEHDEGIRHPHNFVSQGVRGALGGVVILGLVLVICGIVWIVATRRERRRILDLGHDG